MSERENTAKLTINLPSAVAKQLELFATVYFPALPSPSALIPPRSTEGNNSGSHPVSKVTSCIQRALVGRKSRWKYCHALRELRREPWDKRGPPLSLSLRFSSSFRKGGRYQSKLGSLLTKFTSSGGRGEEEVGVGGGFWLGVLRELRAAELGNFCSLGEGEGIEAGLSWFCRVWISEIVFLDESYNPLLEISNTRIYTEYNYYITSFRFFIIHLTFQY